MNSQSYRDDSSNSFNEVEDIDKEYTRSLFTSIESELKSCFSNNDYNFTFSKEYSKSKLTIKIKMRKNSLHNLSDLDIYFVLIVDKYFPEIPPLMKCLTNFCFPSLCDGRNLTTSLFPFTWRSNIKITEIVKNLGHLVNRAFLHSKVRIITNFGNYYLNSLYDLNDFIIDTSNDLFKSLVEIKIFNKNKEKIELEKRYIVISDAMMLIFIPDQSLKNLGKLIFYSSLMHIDKLIDLEMDSNTEKILQKNAQNKEKTFLRFKIAWKESDIYIGNISSYDNTLLMEFEEFGNFSFKLSEKKDVLMNSSELFSEDYMKFSNLDSLKSADESKLVELAFYHESLFMKAFGMGNFDKSETQVLLKEQAKEIVFLYQKIVEILSVKNDQNFSVYMSKMQNFLEIARAFLEDVKENNFQLLDQSFA